MVVQHQCCGCGSAGSAAATTGAGCTTTPTGARHAAAPCYIAKSSAMCGPSALGRAVRPRCCLRPCRLRLCRGRRCAWRHDHPRGLASRGTHHGSRICLGAHGRPPRAASRACVWARPPNPRSCAWCDPPPLRYRHAFCVTHTRVACIKLHGFDVCWLRWAIGQPIRSGSDPVAHALVLHSSLPRNPTEVHAIPIPLPGLGA